MFLTINNGVMGVAKHLLAYTNPTHIFDVQVDERLRVISSEVGNQAMV